MVPRKKPPLAQARQTSSSPSPPRNKLASKSSVEFGIRLKRDFETSTDSPERVSRCSSGPRYPSDHLGSVLEVKGRSPSLEPKTSPLNGFAQLPREHKQQAYQDRQTLQHSNTAAVQVSKSPLLVCVFFSLSLQVSRSLDTTNLVPDTLCIHIMFSTMFCIKFSIAYCIKKFIGLQNPIFFHLLNLCMPCSFSNYSDAVRPRVAGTTQ